MIHGHGGNIYEMAKILNCHIDDITDMSSNLNPLGPPPGFYSYLKDQMNRITSLPEVDAREISKKVAEKYGTHPEKIIAGNGTTQLIYTIPQALKIKKCLIVAPTYADYRDAMKMYGIEHEFYYLKEEDDFKLDVDNFINRLEPFDTVFICNPNNPTGGLVEAEVLKRICRKSPDTLFVIDESYLPFVKNSHELTMVNARLKNVIVLNSMSKVFRIPGLRVGFLLADNMIIEKFHKYMMPWSVNSIAQAAVTFLTDVKNGIDAFLNQTERFVEEERSCFMDTFKGNTKIKLFPGETYFVLGKLLGTMNAPEICKKLSEDKILIRDCSNFKGLSDSFIRVSLKDREANMMLSEKFQKLI